MGGAADFPQRSSSPLKRRASSMEPEQENADAREDVDMITAPDSQGSGSEQGTRQQQDEQETAGSGTSDRPVANVAELPLRTDIPPVDQQIKTIEALVKAFSETPPKAGDEAYLVSRQWLSRAQACCPDAKHATKGNVEGSPGPVDNSDIIQAIFTDSNGTLCVKLKPGMGTENFELFPKDAWDLLMSWYGLAPGQTPIVRFAHNTAPDSVSVPTIQFEFHPPVFTIHRLWSATSPIPIHQELKLKNPPPPVVFQSTSFSYHNFLKQVKALTDVSLDRKVRVWRLLQTIPATESPSEPPGMKTPPDSPGRTPDIPNRPPASPGAWPAMLVDVETFLKLERDVERGLVEAEDTTTNPNYNGRKSLSLVGLAVDQTLVLDEQVDRDSYVSTFKGSSMKDRAIATRGSSSSLPALARGTASGRNSPSPLGPQTRGRMQQKSGRTIGCVGLQNLGNTCYMNSALHCVRSVEELTKYFLTHEAQKEINPDNPLSHNGDVAVAYGRLLEEIYKDPAPSSLAPRHFKSIIGRYAPAFSGYGQQDSQEFVGFLLDGLQEDLNRIKKKPYIEKPDSTDDMINNPAAIREMAAKVWDITKKRDDSVIADLFTGMYKSTLVCPVCDKVSITFDPFNNLTLPLPVANVWSRPVKFYPLNAPPVEIVVDIDKNSSIKTMKQYISVRVGVPLERLYAIEEFQGKIFKIYEDMATVSEEIQASDVPAVHELEAPPTNTQGAKKLKKPKFLSLSAYDDDEESPSPGEDPLPERMLVPVLHRMEPTGRRRYGQKKTSDIVPPPHFIVLTPDEARDMEAIRRKILEKVATFTTLPGLSTADDTEGSETTDPEIINIASDVDSAGDAKIIARSVEGEEDIVDVRMSDATSARKTTASAPPEASSPLLKRFKQSRPKWINPLVFLDPELQNMFDMSYFSEQDTAVPTGWQSTSDEAPLPRLSTRLPKPVPSDIDMRSPTPGDGSDESGSEESARLPASVVTRMVEESSDEDSDFPKVKHLQSRPNGTFHSQVSARGKNKKMKSYRTYSKKGKKRFEKQQRAFRPSQSMEVADMENALPSGALVGPGEGLMVEWNEDAFDRVFGGSPSDNGMRGMKTYKNLTTLEDPALEAKKKQRQMRKKHGISLDDCLDEFEKEEILSEQDTWYCPRCKEHRRASKKFDLWKTPDILIVHLKRFSSSGWRRDKLDILVDFPVEGLDLTQRVIDKEDGKQEVYDLIAVDDHWGGLGGGHYTAFAKNFIDGEWYEYNDTSVQKQADTSRIVTSAAYLLFYRRRSEVPLGGPKFQEILDRYNNQANAADEDASDLGEGQRLGQGSSRRGSPSALTGAGLILPQENRGLASLADAELPPYQLSTANVGEADDEAELGGPLSWSTHETLRNSIEGDGEDEGIGLGEYDSAGMAGMTSVLGPTNWNFAGLDSKPDSEADVDIASDVAQNDGSSVNGEVFHGDLESLLPVEPGAGYAASSEPVSQFAEYDDPPAPSDEQQNYLGQIAVETWDRIHKVPAAGLGDDQGSDKVAEIHVGDAEEQAVALPSTGKPQA